MSLALDNARLYQEAQRAIKDRELFLSVAAHELKTPVTSLKGFAQLLVRHLTNKLEGLNQPGWKGLFRISAVKQTNSF